jgi:[ribosomal protein S5]-alanine N-acetyltransferase
MMIKAIPAKIEAERIDLRCLRLADVEPFYEFVHDESAKYLYFTDEQRTRDGARELVESVIDSYDTDSPSSIFAISDKETGDFVGHVGATSIENTNDLELFYALLPKYRGKGYVTDAVRTFIAFLLDSDIETVVAIIELENEASIAVMTRLHARFAGECEIHGNLGHRYEFYREITQLWSSFQVR